MQVTLRHKKITDSRQSLYLDFYPEIRHPDTGRMTRREFLNLYIYDNPSTAIEKHHNKETLRLAMNIQAQRQLSLQAEDYGFLKRDNANDDFLVYFKKLADEHKAKDGGDKNNWLSVYRYLDRYTNGNCLIKDVTEEFCNGFKKYLQQSSTFVETKTQLANNSAVGYFNIFKRVIKEAFKARLLNVDYAKDVAAIKRTETRREYVSLEELRKLAATDCDLPSLKNAALFSALTGLRYSDIEKLVWSEVIEDGALGHTIRFTQKKTKGVETLPISDDAYGLLGERKADGARIFPKLFYSAWQNLKLEQWVYRAGIHRKITFHAFRHTFATLQLSLGTDIYTISKMLGHRSLNTTQVYAKIMDKAKRVAADKIRLK